MAILAAFFLMWLLSGLWNLVIVSGFAREHAAHLMRESLMILPIIAGYLVLSFLLGVAYLMARVSGSPLQKGMKVGAFMGLAWILPFSLVLHGVLDYPLPPVIVDSLWAVVEVGTGGALIGLIMGAKETQ
jgi:hypothetical protein